MAYEHHIGDLKKGDKFCEFDGYIYAVRFEAIEDGRLDGDYWKCRGRALKTGKIVEFGVHKDYLHYGPELYLGDNVPYNHVKFE